MSIKKMTFMFTLIFGLSVTANAALFNGHDYIVVDAEGITWDDAKAAVIPGYYLATVSSAAENNFIRDLVNALGGEEYWLGGSQPAGAAANDLWSWENGEGLFWDQGASVGGAYANWNPIEPSGDGMHLAMWANSNRFGFTSGTWNDEGNISIAGWLDGYVMESIPEPISVVLFILGIVGVGLSRSKSP